MRPRSADLSEPESYLSNSPSHTNPKQHPARHVALPADARIDHKSSGGGMKRHTWQHIFVLLGDLGPPRQYGAAIARNL